MIRVSMLFRPRAILLMCALASQIAPFAFSQEASTTAQSVAIKPAIPALINYSGTLTAADGKPLQGEVDITFLLFKDSTGGQPLWVETQTVRPDSGGHYSAVLGTTTSQGLPQDIFVSGEARWLEVQVSGQRVQPRVQLVAVPYAMKAGDAETVGGLPASAFRLATPSAAGSATAAGPQTDTAVPSWFHLGSKDRVVKFNAAGFLTDSEIVDNGDKVGVGTTAPEAKLDVNGSSIFRGPLTLPASGEATASAAAPSQPLNLIASEFDNAGNHAVQQTFQWQAEPGGNTTKAPASSLDLLFGLDNATPAPTGFSISNQGLITFAPGQTFPAAAGASGKGTVTSVALTAPSSDFTVTGSPVTTSGTLALQWVQPPAAGDVPNTIMKRDEAGYVYSSAFVAVNNLYSYGGLNVGGKTFLDSTLDVGGAVGIGTNTPQAELNLNYGSTATADSLLLGNNTSKGLQMRDNGTGVDLESIGVPLYVNFVTQQPLYLNPNGGAVTVGNTSYRPGLLNVGAIPDGTGNYISAAFSNDVHIQGNMFVDGTKNFRIDHPLDPTNKYLTHASIESSEVLNQYRGNVLLDEKGEARVEFPDWFPEINTDFSYQLTAVGAPGPNLYVSREMEGNSFSIAGGSAGMKVSWQVTARRDDSSMKAHPMVVEQEKPAWARGHYTNPELYGAPKE